MIEKKDPKIKSYRNPFPQEEMREISNVNFLDIDFYFGVVVNWGQKIQDIPSEVGRIRAEAWIHSYDENGVLQHEWPELKTIPCQELIP